MTQFPEPVFPFTTLAQLPGLASNATTTVTGVITNVGQLKDITTRKRKQTFKCEFLLADDSDTEILCTVWGQNAEVLQEAMQGRVDVVKDGQASDYMNVRSINSPLGTLILHDPTLAKSAELLHWFANIPLGHSFNSIHG
ncbi:hypothetical protein PR003_g7579 [Phytophthora rubi]|uniref:Replication protein A OB domain-containing protein n=1 Tax=Phytophthora rubi TaxID=129364 RepID=A0A6A4FDJ7_9STRA|nr:hypothetical protein PR002_g7383 [Phytophthora rubi]KAE9041245.1 hypothetical protein PR001_g6700 [Phytophthora rubi]KAE9346142.1 hypothetical protein PR003_g7579 [Phytophthora rubi]